jgi:tetratricopeptide (TPR) repeat protein
VSPQRWNRVRELFDSALDRPPAEVEDYLRDACGGDDVLLSEVHQMLEQHRAAGFLDAPPARRAPSFQTGDITAGRYGILRPLGRGGMGQVYEAEDTELRERVALKTLLPEISADSGMISRFKREIQLARKIGHPNVCRVFDLARHPADGSSPDTALFLTMEFLEGGTLADRIGEGRIAPAEALRLIAQMADALDAAHRAGIIHRDFKPGNVMLVPGGRGAVVTDFGLARSVEISGDTTATGTGQLVGTIDYMAPELFAGEPATPAADQYALALVAYKMVSGRLPFQSDSPLAGVVRRAGQRPPSVRDALPELDPSWDQAFARALDPDPTRRFATCTTFVDALRGRSQSVTLNLPRLTRRKWAAAVAAALVLLAAPFAWRAWQRARMRPSPEAEALYQQGAADLHAGAYFAATKALGQAVAIAPHFTLAHARLAEAWVGLDLTEKATQEMLIVRRQDLSALSRLERLQVEAIDFTITREFETAATKYREMLTVAPSTAEYVDLGRAYDSAGKPDDAIKAYLHATQAMGHGAAAWLSLGVLYTRQGKAAQAENAFHHAEDVYRADNNLEGLTELAFQRGAAASSHNHFDDSTEFLKQALETAKLAGNVHQEMRSKLSLSGNAYRAGDAPTAERYAREALDTARLSRIDVLAVRGLVNLGHACNRKRDYRGAERYYQEALTVARTSNSGRLTAIGLLSLAALHDAAARYGESETEAAEALPFYQANRFAIESTQCLTILGRARLWGHDDAKTAADYFQKALRLAQGVQDPGRTALVEESLGTALSAQEAYPDALTHFQKELELSTSDENRGYANLNAAEMLWRIGRYADAEEAFRQAETSAARFPALTLRVMRERASMSLSLERFPEARRIATQAVAEEAGRDPRLASELAGVLGMSLTGSREFARGLKFCRQSLEAAEQFGEIATIRARLAVAQALIDAGQGPAALSALNGHEPDADQHPESRWRMFALMARVDSRFVPAARNALNDLRSRWGESAFSLYLTRPDVVWLSRPISPVATAKP